MSVRQAHLRVVLGIAGPLASGKSTVLEMLRELGTATLRADDVSRELLQPGQPLLEEVRTAFGAELFAPDGTLQRKKLAALIFLDPQARERLNQIMHPPMTARLEQTLAECRQADNGPQVVAVEAAILHEMGLDRITDEILLVTAPPDVRIRRLQERDGLSEAEAGRRVKLHDEMGLAEIEADYVIDTGGDLVDTRCQVEQLWEERWSDQPQHKASEL